MKTCNLNFIKDFIRRIRKQAQDCEKRHLEHTQLTIVTSGKTIPDTGVEWDPTAIKGGAMRGRELIISKEVSKNLNNGTLFLLFDQSKNHKEERQLRG